MYSEKLDGIRCLWTGTEMITRNGLKLKVPDYFTKSFPYSPMDGELYIGKGKFEELHRILKQGRDHDWLQVTFFVFDAPSLNL